MSGGGINLTGWNTVLTLNAIYRIFNNLKQKPLKPLKMSISERLNELQNEFRSNREELLDLFLSKLPETEYFEKPALRQLAEIQYLEFVNEFTKTIIQNFKE